MPAEEFASESVFGDSQLKEGGRRERGRREGVKRKGVVRRVKREERERVSCIWDELREISKQ